MMNYSPMRKYLPQVNSFLVDLPAPSNLSYLWNYGSLLSMMLLLQMMSGVILSMFFISDPCMAFDSVIHLDQDVTLGWVLRMLHVNSSSVIFLFMYIHYARGMYYCLFNPVMWYSGSTILLVMIMTAFTGYSLPWGQMSFWAVTVITNFLSVLPILGTMSMEWLWGGYSVDTPTLVRFFTFHYLLAFMVSLMVLFHVVMLHGTGSDNPLGTNSNMYKVWFHPMFTYQDILGVCFVLMLFLCFVFYNPYMLLESENFEMSMPMVTPSHIQPEWYFLFAYSILRSVPSKLGGVVSMVFSILIIFFYPLLWVMKLYTSKFYPMCQVFFFFYVMSFLLLSWFGSMVVSDLISFVNGMLSMIYFLSVGLYFISFPIWDYMNK